MSLYVVEIRDIERPLWRRDEQTFTGVNAARQRRQDLLAADTRAFPRKRKGQPVPLRKKECYRVVPIAALPPCATQGEAAWGVTLDEPASNNVKQFIASVIAVRTAPPEAS